ncbi:zinc-ribbon domain-containing protein [Senegalimassilia anaerobia]|uniref:zinc-ribbon domain-containing protein n=1 Tax=Senegalimassilia anaerobia TaxID=1473216 RepID=UPI003A8D1F80
MFCANCGKPIEDDARFCEFCGTPVLDEGPASYADDVSGRQAGGYRLCAGVAVAGC